MSFLYFYPDNTKYTPVSQTWSLGKKADIKKEYLEIKAMIEAKYIRYFKNQ